MFRMTSSNKRLGLQSQIPALIVSKGCDLMLFVRGETARENNLVLAVSVLFTSHRARIRTHLYVCSLFYMHF